MKISSLLSFNLWLGICIYKYMFYILCNFIKILQNDASLHSPNWNIVQENGIFVRTLTTRFATFCNLKTSLLKEYHFVCTLISTRSKAYTFWQHKSLLIAKCSPNCCDGPLSSPAEIDDCTQIINQNRFFKPVIQSIFFTCNAGHFSCRQIFKSKYELPKPTYQHFIQPQTVNCNFFFKGYWLFGHSVM